MVHTFVGFQTYSLPYNKYAWITTHNAYAIEGEQSILGTTIISPKNQEDSVTSQLNVSSVFVSKPEKLLILFLNFEF